MISSLTILADVELQLVLQWLNNDERLKTARTCKGLYHACNASFAWTHATEVCINNATACNRLRRSLLRWAPTSFTLKRGAGGDDATLKALGGITRLTNLDTTACLGVASERMLTKLASMGVVGCRNLRTLRLPGINDDSSASETIARNSPRLTAITINNDVMDNWNYMTTSKLSALASFDHLEQLSLRGNIGCDSRPLMVLPPLAHLRVLTLEGFYVRSDSFHEWARDSAASLGGLTHLFLFALDFRTRMGECVAICKCNIRHLPKLLAVTPRLEKLDIDFGDATFGDITTFANVLRELTPMLRRLTSLSPQNETSQRILSDLNRLTRINVYSSPRPVRLDHPCLFLPNN